VSDAVWFNFAAVLIFKTSVHVFFPFMNFTKLRLCVLQAIAIHVCVVYEMRSCWRRTTGRLIRAKLLNWSSTICLHANSSAKYEINTSLSCLLLLLFEKFVQYVEYVYLKNPENSRTLMLKKCRPSCFWGDIVRAESVRLCVTHVLISFFV